MEKSLEQEIKKLKAEQNPKKRFKKKKSKMGKLLLFILMGLVLFIVSTKFKINLLDYVFKTKKQEVKPQEPEVKPLPLVKVFHVIKTDFKDNLPVMGTVRGVAEIDMRFESNGVIKKMNYVEGDLVGAGEVLAEIDPAEMNLKIDYQRANLEAAQSTFLGASKKLANAEKMFNIGAILISKLDESILEADNAAMKMQSAKVELLSAEHELTKTKLVANISGVIGVLHMEAGEFATSNDKVLTLIDISNVYVDLGITEKDIEKIAIGLGVTISVDAYPDKKFEGTISNILPVIEGKSRTLTARVEVANDENLLLPGMFARANIAIFEDKNTFMIPSVALNRTKEGYSVNVVDANNVVESRKVEIGYITTEYVQVLSGLEEDEFIVVESQQEIKDQDKVQIIEVQESTLA